MQGADHTTVSTKAKQRGRPQLGTLGAGNHYCEVQVVGMFFKIFFTQVFFFCVLVFVSLMRISIVLNLFRRNFRPSSS